MTTSKSPRPLAILAGGIATFLLLAPTSVKAVDYHFNVATGDWNTAGSWLENAVPTGGGGNFAFINNGGTVSITGNIPSIQDPFIGSGGGTSGTVNHSAGTFSNSGWTFVGEQGGTGTYNLTGAANSLGSGSLTTGNLYIGGRRGVTPGGSGTLRVNTTGSLTTNGDFSVGTRGATGQVNITAGTVNARTWMIVGESEGGFGGGSGTVVQDGGTVIQGGGDQNARFWIGSQEGPTASPATNGSYTLNNGSLSVRNAIIGKNFTGTFTQNGGSMTIDTAIYDSRLGEAGGAVGNYNLNNGILAIGANFQIGASGTGNFTQTGGTATATNFPVIGRFVGGQGTLAISGGSFSQTDAGAQLIVGEEGLAALNVSGGGTINALGALNIGTQGTGNGTVTQTGGNVNVSGALDVQGLGTGVYKLNGGSLAVNGTIDATNGTFTFGAGTLTRGNPGVISFNGNLTAGSAGSTLGLDANKTFNVSGAFTKNIGITLRLTGLTIPAYSGSGIDTGSFALGLVGSIVGSFGPSTDTILGLNNVPAASFISEAAGEGVTFDPYSQSVFWVQENAGSVSLRYSVVPEPTALGLLAFAGAAFLGRRRRK